MFLLFSLLLLCSRTKQETISEYQICIRNGTEADTSEPIPCVEDYNSTCYNFLEDLPVENDSLITLCAHRYTLSTTIKFENLHGVKLTGLSSETTISCSKYRNTGLEIVASENIEITNVCFENCGALHNSTSSQKKNGIRIPVEITTSLFVVNSTDIRLWNVNVLRGNGTGVILLNSYGNVTDCVFEENKVTNKTQETRLAGGGGMYIEMNTNMRDRSNLLVVERCTFLNNEALSLTDTRRSYTRCNSDYALTLGRGGGLAAYLRGTAKDVTLNISNITIKNNHALWGGGMYIQFCKQVYRNKVNIDNANFSDNSCEYAGGGINIGFTLEDDDTSTNNSLAFRRCKFESNSALSGGGIGFFSKETDTPLYNFLLFSNCTWLKNRAQYGAALDMVPELTETPLHGDLPHITLNNVTFQSNIIIVSGANAHELHQKDSDFNKRLGPAAGTFLVTGMTIHFMGHVRFNNNNGSGIYAISAVLDFGEQTTAEFVGNCGFRGGAVALIGFSAIWVHDNVTVSMKNNTAALGGALYHYSIDKHDYLFSHNCFIQKNPVVQERTPNGVRFDFSSNKGFLNGGNSIYVATLLPCLEYCDSFDNKSLENIFKCLGEFQFDDGSVATSGAYFEHNISTPVLATPGNKTYIPFQLLDDLDQEVQAVYHATSESDQLFINDTYTSENKLAIKGAPGTKGKIEFKKIGVRDVSFTFEVTLRECPPFFAYSNEQKACMCTRDVDNEYKNIFICISHNYTAYLLHGYWVGYDGERKAENLKYGICPTKYCYSGKEYERYHQLPTRNSEVEKAVCGKTRSGFLCGKCNPGFCAGYHSNNYICTSCKSCKYGWLLYIISEIVPLTILFVMVMTFNINFTSGFLNGFLFYAQVFDAIFSAGKSFIYFPFPVYKLNEIIQLVYKLFNFDFFGIDDLSYCLWEKATVIDLLAFKFLTVAYAALLVVSTVLLMKRCAYSRRCTKSVSMIHGLSAFLVMVYTQCTKISFQLLNYSKISDSNGNKIKVLFYQGELEAFSKHHIPFVVLAILCLIIVTVIPPLFLLSYPLCYKLSSLLRLENTKFTKLLGKLFPMSKLKPVFDSFQGCFKDQYRHFAGLYFVYRIGLLASVLTSDPNLTYVFTQIQLVVILTIHCLCWPYIKRVHNIIDTLVFANLTIINAITIFNYTYSQIGSIYQSTINMTTYIQLFFIYAPFFYLVSYATFFVVKMLWIKMKKGRSDSAQFVEDDIVMERMNSLDDESDSYKHFQDTY